MLNEKFYEVIEKEGVVSIVTAGENEADVNNTWNSYLRITKDERILIPAAGMSSTERNISLKNQVKLTLGSKEVIGTIGPGAGFLIVGTAKFIESGEEFEMMKSSFPFLNKVLEITVTSIKQTI